MNVMMDYIGSEEVEYIVDNYELASKNIIKNYEVTNASDKMLGFLAEYWKLKVVVTDGDEDRRLHFFIKAIPRDNFHKSKFVRQLNIYEKELKFYLLAKSLQLPDIKPWCPKFVAELNEAIVMEDLNALQFQMRNKHEKFDVQHTKQALKTLARLHASSIIYEERKSEELKRPYRINDEYGQLFDQAAYEKSHPWYVQCIEGNLAALQAFSKYREDKQIMNTINTKWNELWINSLELTKYSTVQRSVLCHRDLWNNNILFHYEREGNKLEPDDCVVVDFGAVTCQPPAGDVMQLLYCNLDSQFRERNMDEFLYFYYQELARILALHGLDPGHIIPQDKFLLSAEEQRLWGLISSACLLPITGLDDDFTTKIFTDSDRCQRILCQDKAPFLIEIMRSDREYRDSVIELFEEIVDRYILFTRK